MDRESNRHDLLPQDQRHRVREITYWNYPTESFLYTQVPDSSAASAVGLQRLRPPGEYTLCQALDK